MKNWFEVMKKVLKLNCKVSVGGLDIQTSLASVEKPPNNTTTAFKGKKVSTRECESIKSAINTTENDYSEPPLYAVPFLCRSFLN